MIESHCCCAVKSDECGFCLLLLAVGVSHVLNGLNICLGTVFVVWWEDAYLQDFHEGKNTSVMHDALH